MLANDIADPSIGACEYIYPQQRWKIFNFRSYFDQLNQSRREEMRSRLLSVTSGSSPLENILQLSSAAVIIFEHSYFILDKWRYLQDRQEYGPSFYAALERYLASPHAVPVREGVSAAVQAYEEAMKTVVSVHQGSLPAWIGKLRFKRSQKQKESQSKAELIKTILEITLNHRLPGCGGTVKATLPDTEAENQEVQVVDTPGTGYIVIPLLSHPYIMLKPRARQLDQRAWPTHIEEAGPTYLYSQPRATKKCVVGLMMTEIGEAARAG
ncbi:hypothetical protein EV702DRAFT_1196787 [Suillus placidus]|uniref:Uncharacterized protein n=1 Tax=Suillus placidus TaxID=48579 RepID=A0A9P7D4B7_9AGAM|nr:hypothetical protein EV702DRAFT_1196787 [Suillus placidus]